MSALPVEATEPDPATTSLPNDETVNKEGGNTSAPTEKDAEMPDAESKEANGAAGLKEENGDDKSEKNGAIKKEQLSPKSSRRQYDNKNRRENNSKYDPSVLPTTDDHKKIRAQVEFYFGDANLPTDKFMWDMTDGSTNLPISISKICEFGRMKRFSPYSAVVAALRESAFLEVTGPEGQEQVKRKVPYDPTTPRSKTEARSVYVKGFGDEERSSQFDIEAFFAPYGPTNAVRLRRSDDKLFKGSVFVEFADEETAEKFLKLDPKPLWKGKQELEIKSKKEYMDGKQQEIKDGKMEPGETWAPRRGGRGGNHRGGNSRGNHRGRDRDSRGRGDRDRGSRDGGRDKGDRDPDDWKKRREEDRASGFKDDKRRNDRDRGDTRDHKGNQRGGRRGGRDDRGPRNNDRNREREEEDDEGRAEMKGIMSEESPDKIVRAEKTEEPAQNDKKRGREDYDGGDEAPAKKVDTKSEVAADAS